jgi:DNA-binding PadR family transcriptional regulator
MKLEKYIFNLPKAVKLASTRTGVSRPLIPSELFLLYAIKRLPPPCTQTHLQRFSDRVHNPVTLNTIHKGLNNLVEYGFIERDVRSYSISPLGREFLSYIRRYLINVRL